MTLLRRNPTCPTCNQAVVPPPSSKVVLLRLAWASGAVVAGAVEYLRALRREREAAQLEEQLETSPDVPLDAHLAGQSAPANDVPPDAAPADPPLPSGDWPASHPSLVDDKPAAADATD